MECIHTSARIYLILIVILYFGSFAFCQDELTYNEQIYQTTVQIVGNKGTGTGFLVSFKNPKTGLNETSLVTNRHVASALNKVELNFRVKIDGELSAGYKYQIVVDSFNLKCIYHPDPNVDLAVLEGKYISFNNEKGRLELDFYTIPESYIPDSTTWESLNAGEDIIMIGYPIGLIDEYNVNPILRTGVTATPPKKRYNGKEEFLIDIAIYTGSSGSPVFLVRKPYKIFRKENTIGLEPPFQVYLIGVEYAGHTYNAKTGKFNTYVPFLNDIESNNNFVNLALVIDSRKLLDFKPLLFR